MRKPRRSSRWWEEDELVTLVDALALTALDEAALESLVKDGTVATVDIGGIRYFRYADLLDVGSVRKKSPIGD